MELRDYAENAARSVYEILGAAPTEDQAKQVADALERAAIEIVLEERKRFESVAKECCSPDLDVAHKIAEQVRRDNAALVANLSALR
jgi:hypothetical protein